MKIAVFSDVQGNLPAMEALIEQLIAWQPELVVMNGDLVNRGPRSLECLDLFSARQREQGWIPLRGNHEDFVLRCESETPASPLDAEMRRFTDWTAAQLGARKQQLSTWADHLCLHAPGDPRWVHATHGSIRSNREGISASIPDEELPNRLPEEVHVFVTAHTHKPMLRRFRDTDILNVGSVGTPFDGDIRASYGQLEFFQGHWHSRLLRFAYDRERADRDYQDSGFLDAGGPMARLIYHEWRLAKSLIRPWSTSHEAAVRAGELSLEESVECFLKTL